MKFNLNPTTLFFFKTLFWLPVAFAVWYYMAIILSLPAAWLTEHLLGWLIPDVIHQIQINGYYLEIATNLHPSAQAGVSKAAQQLGYISITINPLIYGYCMPLFTALTLSVPNDEAKAWNHWFIGMAILILIQSWGISFDVFKQLLFQMGDEIANQFYLATWQSDLVALGYQLGYLILPAVTPLVIWIAQNQPFIETLAPSLKALNQKKS